MNGMAVTGICGVLGLALILWFLWGVYRRGGPDDLTKAAWAIRIVIRKNPPASGSGDETNLPTVVPSPREAGQPGGAADHAG